MNIINAAIADRIITASDDHEPLVAGNVGVDFVRFTPADVEWNTDYTYTVTFACGKVAITMDNTKADGTGETITMSESDTGYETPVIEIPHEVLVPGSLRLTLRGYNSDGTEVINTAHMRNGIGVKSKGQTNGTGPHETTQDIVAQAIAATAKATESATNADTATEKAYAAATSALSAADNATTAAGNADTSATKATEAAGAATEAAGKVDTAIEAAEAATKEANEAAAYAIETGQFAKEQASNANDAATAANTATSNADTATANANEAIEKIIKIGNDTVLVEENARQAAQEARDNADYAVVKATLADNAASKANTAAAAADTAASNADTATANAKSATENANTAASAAQTATTNANTATENANEATESAKTATDAANTATENANKATTAANTAATNADTATAAAKTATANATTAADTATTAAGKADTATANATKATTSATNAATAANAAAALANSAIQAYGARFDGSASAGTRLGAAVGLVANPSTDTVKGENDFDNIYPWAGIRMVNGKMTDNGYVVTAVDGQEAFTTAEDTMVQIPLFWYKEEEIDSSTYTWVSPVRQAGWQPNPMCIRKDGTLAEYGYMAAFRMNWSDGTYAGNSTTATPQSVAGAESVWNVSLTDTINAAKRKGANWTCTRIEDIQALRVLFEVEFANRNTQAIMQGNVNQTTVAATSAGEGQFITTSSLANFNAGMWVGLGTAMWNYGTSSRSVKIASIEDGVVTFENFTGSIASGTVMWNAPSPNGACLGVLGASGSPHSNTDGRHPCRYRYIEQPWGDSWEWVSNLLINSIAKGVQEPYYLADPSLYTGSITDDYERLSYDMPANTGYISHLGIDESKPFVRLTDTMGGGTSTYYGDYYWKGDSAGARAVLFGGSANNSSSAGLSCFYVYNAPSYRDVYFRSRLSLTPA